MMKPGTVVKVNIDNVATYIAILLVLIILCLSDTCTSAAYKDTHILGLCMVIYIMPE